jgi:hypothetical protein
MRVPGEARIASLTGTGKASRQTVIGTILALKEAQELIDGEGRQEAANHMTKSSGPHGADGAF